MKILILPDTRYEVISPDAPQEGRYYLLEDAATGTGAQNRAFHSLLSAFWQWMFNNNNFQFQDGNVIYDLSTPDKKAFKDFFKYKYGQGFSHIEYVDDKYRMVKVKDMSEIPDYVIYDFNSGNKNRVKGVLKSWADYTKKQRQNCIDTLLKIIDHIRS